MSEPPAHEEALEDVLRTISGIVLEWCGDEQHWQLIGDENGEEVRVRLLSPYAPVTLAPILRALSATGDDVVKDEPDVTVMYGYRRMLKPEEYGNGRVFNLHISYLPYNRGAHPNLWSWYDSTPKGVSIHMLSGEVDAGPLMARRIVSISENNTLRSSYDLLREAMGTMFFDVWPLLRSGIQPYRSEDGPGSYHSVRESDKLLSQLPLNYDTPVTEVIKMGHAVVGV